MKGDNNEMSKEWSYVRSGGVWEIAERNRGQEFGCMHDQDEEGGKKMMKSSVNETNAYDCYQDENSLT